MTDRGDRNKGKCVWFQKEMHQWMTSCGIELRARFIDTWKFCPYCGKSLGESE